MNVPVIGYCNWNKSIDSCNKTTEKGEKIANSTWECGVEEDSKQWNHEQKVDHTVKVNHLVNNEMVVSKMNQNR